MKYDFKQLSNSMYGIYTTARNERVKLNKKFDKREYEWHVPSKVFTAIQDKMFEDGKMTLASLCAGQPVKLYGIHVICCPLSNRVVLVHSIGGFEV